MHIHRPRENPVLQQNFTRYISKFLAQAAYTQKAFQLKRRSSFLSKMSRTFAHKFSSRAPITSCGSSPLPGPDVKTVARFRRRCARR